jgi:hypothetical protein
VLACLPHQPLNQYRVPSQMDKGRMGIELGAPFALLRQGVGAECDANNEELYVREPS